MDLIIETVKKLETMMNDSGCEDGGIVLDVNPDTINCQFECGACMTASFGGRSADFFTYDPVRARTKVSIGKCPLAAMIAEQAPIKVSKAVSRGFRTSI